MKSSSAGLSARLSSVGVLRRSSKRTYAQKVLSVAPANLLTYWPLWEPSGTVITDISPNARNGVYTGVDLGQPGIGDGRTSPLFDGTNDYGNLYTASFRDAFNGLEGSCSIWIKMLDATSWSDTLTHNIFRFAPDANNQFYFRKQGTNTVALIYHAGAVTKVLTATTTSVAWLHLAATWSKAADQAKLYLNGVQQGATMTGLGTWAGTLGATTTALGAADLVPTLPWRGYLAHLAFWNTPLSATQIASMATL